MIELSLLGFIMISIFAGLGLASVLYLLIRSIIIVVVKDSGEIKALREEEQRKFDELVAKLDEIANSDRDMTEDPIEDEDDISDDEIDDFYPFEEDEDEDEDDEDDDDFDDEEQSDDEDEEDFEDDEPEYGDDELAPMDEILKKYKK